MPNSNRILQSCRDVNYFQIVFNEHEPPGRNGRMRVVIRARQVESRVSLSMGLASATQGWLHPFILAHSMLIIKLFSNLLMYVTFPGESKRMLWGFCLLLWVFRAAGLGQPTDRTLRHVEASAFVALLFCNLTDLVPPKSNKFLHSWQLGDIWMQCDAAVA